MKKRLIIWDFDSTLTLEHTMEHVGSGVSVQNASKENNEAKRNNMRHPHVTLAILRKFQQKGDESVIASFHSGTERVDPKTEVDGVIYIRQYMKNGISNYNWDSTHIIADCTDKDIRDNYGKNFQIEAHVDAFNKRNPNDKIDLSKPEDRERVILVDDDPNNIEKSIQLLKLPLNNAINVNDGFDNHDHFLKLIEKCGLTSGELIKETAEIMNSTLPALRKEQSYIARLIKKVQELEKSNSDKKNLLAQSQTQSLTNAPTVASINFGTLERKNISEAEQMPLTEKNNPVSTNENHCLLYALQCLKDSKLPMDSINEVRKSREQHFTA